MYCLPRVHTDAGDDTWIRVGVTNAHARRILDRFRRFARGMMMLDDGHVHRMEFACSALRNLWLQPGLQIAATFD